MRKPATHIYRNDKQRRMVVQAGVCYQKRILPYATDHSKKVVRYGNQAKRI